MTEHRLRIDAMGRRGEGLAGAGQQRLFIAGALPGEEVLADGDGAQLSLTSVLRASPERIDPLCSHYGRCGGCQLQHWQDAPYRAWKAAQVSEALAARGLIHPAPDCVDAHGAGRRRVSLHARQASGKVTAGYMAARSHALIDISKCPILEPVLGPAFDIARAMAAQLGDCDVALSATLTGLDASVRAERGAVKARQAELPQLIHDLGLARLSVNGEIIATAVSPRVMLGRAEVVIPPGGFLQATALGEATLARFVLDAVGKAKSVADLFCGIGPFSFRLAESARVAAFDSDRGAIAALNDAVRSTAGLKPITASVRDLFREPLVPNEMKDFDAVVFDPPRAGAEAQARQLARSQVRTVVAVACDAQSFARDAALLTAGGYALKRLVTVDQFKWSSHVEIAALFMR